MSLFVPGHTAYLVTSGPNPCRRYSFLLFRIFCVNLPLQPHFENFGVSSVCLYALYPGSSACLPCAKAVSCCGGGHFWGHEDVMTRALECVVHRWGQAASSEVSCSPYLPQRSGRLLTSGQECHTTPPLWQTLTSLHPAGEHKDGPDLRVSTFSSGSSTYS